MPAQSSRVTAVPKPTGRRKDESDANSLRDFSGRRSLGCFDRGAAGSAVQDRPGKVYYRNRGLFLEHTVQDLLPQYPLGAGLGRWGMMNLYFGDNSDPERACLWAELQWTGWVLDGGVPLLLAYAAALALACRTALQITLLRNAGNLWLWGGVLLAYNLGAVAVTFSYTFFVGQGGLEFWLLNAVLFGAARTQDC